MPLEANRQYCCCFTGHREDKLQRLEKEVLDDLKQAIIQAVDDGYTTFITGMAYGLGRRACFRSEKETSEH